MGAEISSGLLKVMSNATTRAPSSRRASSMLAKCVRENGQRPSTSCECWSISTITMRQSGSTITLRQSGYLWSRPRKRNRVSKDRKSTRLNSSHDQISYAVFCLKKKKKKNKNLKTEKKKKKKNKHN